MGSARSEKPHAVVVPFPTQGHITPALKLAKLLHSNGIHITFVNTEFNHDRLLRSQGAAVALGGLEDFRFESIPDGLPPSDPDATQDLPTLLHSVTNYMLTPFLWLFANLNDPSSGLPPVTSIISDGMMSFCIDAAGKLGIPDVVFWTASAAGLMGYLHFHVLVERGLTPLPDESCLTNGYLDAPVEWIPGLTNIRLRDLPSFLRTTDPDDIFFNFLSHQARRVAEGMAVIINTIDDLESPVLDALSAMLPPIYTIGPINLLSRRFPESPQLKSIGSSLWKEDPGCIEWLSDRKEPGSVVFVNFGSITTMSNAQLIEFAWGLAGSGYDFLWVIRGDLVKGESAVLPPDFFEETEGRRFMVRWCPQEEILEHQAVGVFLTHAGWNSTLESFSAGVPIMCWPFFAEQTTNCRYACGEWGVGMEINNNVKREEVAAMVREMMSGEKGRERKKKAMEWKERAKKATEKGGSSIANLETVVKEMLHTIVIA